MIRILRAGLLVGLMVAGVRGGTETLWAQQAQSSHGVMTREEAGAVMPATVFFRGQSAPIQARNSSGVKMDEGRLVLAALVDTSGYSTGIAQRYQGYLITEVPLRIEDQTLAPGAYGFGFVEGDRMVVMDVGANELFHTHTLRDAALARPNPLQIVADPAGEGKYRLYLGRSYVVLAAGARR